HLHPALPSFPTRRSSDLFNADGILDLAVLDSGSSSMSVLLGNGDGTFQAARNFATGRGPSSVAVGDFNGDGIADLAVANSIDNRSEERRAGKECRTRWSL